MKNIWKSLILAALAVAGATSLAGAVYAEIGRAHV